MHRCRRKEVVEDGAAGGVGVPREEWSAGSVADQEISRDTSALMKGANYLRNSEVLSSARLVRGGLRVQGC